METRLHSYETYLFKYLLPIMGIPWDGFSSLRRAFPPTEPNHAIIIWVATAVWCVTLVLFVWYGLRLKTVFINQTGLRIRGYVTEIEIPFSQIASVKHNWFRKNATLHLNDSSAFGANILFIPRLRIATEHGKISTLDMLRNRIA
jgi:hypothetical protein